MNGQKLSEALPGGMGLEALVAESVGEVCGPGTEFLPWCIGEEVSLACLRWEFLNKLFLGDEDAALQQGSLD